MSALLFLAGFEKKTKPDDVTNYISDAFDKNEVLHLWMDPNRNARAVALLKTKLETKEIEDLCREVKLHDKFILTEPTKPAKSVLVKYKEDGKLCFGILDKMKYLFTSQRHTGCTVKRVKPLSSKSCEVYFNDGWDAVQKACEQSWKEQQLMVIPYFKCFKEDIEKQLERIPSQDPRKKKDSHDKGMTKDKQQQLRKKSHGNSSGDEWSDERAAQQPLPESEKSSTDESDKEMKVDVATHDTSDEEDSPHTASVGRKQKKDGLKQSEAGKQIKVSKVVFHHDFVWRFLIMLEFKKAVKAFFPKLIIESDGGEAVIKGEGGSVETVEKMLQQANLKVTKKLERLLHQDQQIRQELLHECDEFLSRPDIQEKLEEYISGARLSVVLNDTEGNFSVMVANHKSSEKVPFPQWVTSQISVEKCLSLSDENFEDDSKWLNFVASSNKKYPLIHISVIDKSVFLLWLTCCGSAGSDTVAKKITKFIENLDAPVSDGSAVASVTKDDDSMSESGKSKKKSKKVSIVGFSPFLIWVMNVLKMNEAAEDVFENSTVHVNEEEGQVDVSGRKEDVDALKAFLMSLNKKNSLSDEVEDFLNCRPVQQYLKNCLATMELKIETSPHISMSVLHENGKKDSVEMFIKNLLKHETCESLPLSLKYNSEWQMLVQSIHEKHSLLHVFVVDDKVSVLTVATQDSPETAAVIGKINGFIKSKTDVLSETSTDTKQQSYHFSAGLHENKFSVKNLSFPGLAQFLGSREGKNLIKQLQDQHRCNISYLDHSRSQSGMQLDRQEATEDSAGLQYKVAMLATARGRGFNIHLIQGEMHDLDVEMRITLHSSSKEPCTFKDLVDKYNVEVTDIYKHLDSQMHKTLFCYPIHGSLELNSFPACKETFPVPQNLKFSIRHLQKEYGGDGPIDGEVVPLSLFSYRNECVICCPEWGMGCQQVISDALKTFLHKGKDCETVRIVPPGMHTFPQYPKQFLAQAVFRELDELFKNNWSLRHKKIVIAVEDFAYRKAFEKELQKRKPKQEEQKWFQGLRNWWQESKPGNKSKGSVEKVLKSSVPSTTVTIASTSDVINEKAARELEEELEKLMAHNTVTRTLSNKETEELKKIVTGMPNMQVQITIETHFKPGGTGSKRGSHKNMDSNKLAPKESVITVKGLEKHIVREFMSMATGQPSASDDETATGGPQAETHEHYDWSGNDDDEPTSFVGNPSSMENTGNAELSFRWLYQTKFKDGTPTFQYYDEDICKRLEKAYVKGVKTQLMKKGGPFSKVDFSTMTIAVKNKDKGIIHMELIDESSSATLPYSWQKSQSFCVREIEKDTDAYMELQELKECLNKQLSLEKVERVENEPLYRRIATKKSQLRRPSEIRMWHRVKEEYKNVACEYGFHPLFSAMPKAKQLGEGVLFYRDAKSLLTSAGRQKGKVFLIYSAVYPGKSGPGQEKLRCAPFDHNGERCDSTEDDASVMVFSDAQAYPLYLITLTVNKK